MSHPQFFPLAAPAVAAAALLFAGGAEAAPPHGGGHAGGGPAAVTHGGAVHVGAVHAGAVHVGAVHAGAVHGAAIHGGNFHGGNFHGGNFHHGGFGIGVGIGLGYPYGLGYGGYYGGYYAPVGGYAADYYPPSYYSAPDVSYYVTPQAPQAPAGPAVYNLAEPGAGAPAAPQDPVAHVTVKVPADADVWFGQGKTQQTGTQREFVSPPLTPGKDFSYEVKARWMEDGKEVVQTRQVEVSAGAWKVIDFTKPVPEQLEPPKPKP
jgi:uncharacterized protein (TIGR03000 family)